MPLGMCYIPQAILWLETHSMLLPALVGWVTFIFIAWVTFGDSSKVNKTQFKRYRSVWVTFSLVLFTLFSIYYLYDLQIKKHVQAFHSDTLLLTDIISADRVDGEAHTSLKELLASAIITDTQRLNATLTMTPDHVEISRVLLTLYADSHQLNTFANLAQRVTLDSFRQNEVSQTITSEVHYNSLQPVLTELVTTTKQISLTLAALTEANKADQQWSVQLPQQKQNGIALLNYFKQADTLVRNVDIMLRQRIDNFSNLFVLEGILFVVFLLLPWLLLFLFLLRNVDVQVNNKLATLDLLHLRKAYSVKSSNKGSLTSDIIIDQAFRNSEYVVSLTLFTVITAIMWHLVLYPSGWSGLAQWIAQDIGVTGFTTQLTKAPNALTFGFLGAYFFVLQMLFRRYLAGDLNPKPYINATVRMVVVFVLSLLLNTIDISIMEQHWIHLLAFVAGVFPLPVFQWFLHAIAENVPRFKELDMIRGPLTDIDGINIWHEDRLLEEGVENIQNLATAALDELIVHTNFYPEQLVHWIDQALLYTQVGKQWKECLYCVGIQTATDLYNADPACLVKALSNKTPCQVKQNENAQPLTDEEVKAVLCTMKKALEDMPNLFCIRDYWLNHPCRSMALQQIDPQEGQRVEQQSTVL